MAQDKKNENRKRILMVSRWGESLDIALAMKEEGHKVKFYIEDRHCREIGTGFVPKVRNWKNHEDWADLIVFDYTGFGVEAQRLRAAGKLVFGGVPYSDALELDRNFGQEELRKHKINTIQSWEFHSFQEAISFVEANPNAYVIKPSGETQELKQLLFVGKDDQGQDVIRLLKAYEKSWGEDFGNFQLQRRVKGVEISIGAFFNGERFLKPYNITFEHKKLFPKEVGVSTGEMGSSMFWTQESPLFDRTLKKFEATLARHNLRGHIDLNCIVNGNGIYPLEFTSRFGFPQVSIQRAGLLEPMSELLFGVAAGTKKTFQTRKGFQVGAYIAVPPFPYDDKKTFELFSKDAVVVVPKNMEGIHPMHLKQIKGQWLITGNTGLALLVTGTGLTMKDAQRVMYNRIANIIVNNGYYRTDIGDRWFEDSDKLWSWGYL